MQSNHNSPASSDRALYEERTPSNYSPTPAQLPTSPGNTPYRPMITVSDEQSPSGSPPPLAGTTALNSPWEGPNPSTFVLTPSAPVSPRTTAGILAANQSIPPETLRQLCNSLLNTIRIREEGHTQHHEQLKHQLRAQTQQQQQQQQRIDQLDEALTRANRRVAGFTEEFEIAPTPEYKRYNGQCPNFFIPKEWDLKVYPLWVKRGEDGRVYGYIEGQS